MSKLKHTPGPWTVVNFSDELYPVVIGPEGDERIALIAGNQDNPTNADLIACAPEMLDALRTAHYQVRNRVAELKVNGGPGEALTGAIDALAQIAGVIAKAEGRE